MKILQILEQVFCNCRETLTRREGNRMFTECLKCGKRSTGIETGGHNYMTAKAA